MHGASTTVKGMGNRSVVPLYPASHGSFTASGAHDSELYRCCPPRRLWMASYLPKTDRGSRDMA
jgi:hypothetical protein